MASTKGEKRTKITYEIGGFIMQLANQPEKLTATEIHNRVVERFNINIVPQSISRYINKTKKQEEDERLKDELERTTIRLAAMQMAQKMVEENRHPFAGRVVTTPPPPITFRQASASSPPLQQTQGVAGGVASVSVMSENAPVTASNQQQKPQIQNIEPTRPPKQQVILKTDTDNSEWMSQFQS